MRLEREPTCLFHELKTLAAGSWVVLDEVQKVPSLLNEVQRLLEDCGLRRLRKELAPQPVRTFGVYLGERRALLDDVLILPAAEFLRMLWNGDIVPA